MKRFALLIPLVFVLCSLFFACSSDPDDNTPGPTLKVYAAGSSFNNNGIDQACYWLNGAGPTPLEDEGLGSCAYAVAVAGGKVYISGQYNDGANIRACYWVDGHQVTLGAEGENSWSYANTIAVVGTDVYVAGQYNSGGYNRACYWKTDAAQQTHEISLQKPPTSEYAYAQAIFVLGTDVYVAGAYGGASGEIPCYWVNGVIKSVAAPEDANITAIAVVRE